MFAHPEDGFVRGARNYHRLEHLGRRGKITLYEETITDLLVAEMVGHPYEVSANCPACGQNEACTDWCGSGVVKSATKMRPLTKAMEGGNKRTHTYGAHADLLFAFTAFDPDDPKDAAAARETRMLVQCKRVEPGESFEPDEKQYRKLVNNAGKYGAAPYYGLYVQQPKAHDSSPTRCTAHKKACDLSIVLVPAKRREKSPYYLPGKLVEDVLALGRPLRCLGGCRCIGTKTTDDANVAALAFVRANFPTYKPTRVDRPTPSAPAIVAVNSARGKPPVPADRYRRPAGDPVRPTMDDNFLVVRLGKQVQVEDDQRDLIGYDKHMTLQQLRDAARMYWRCNPARAAQLRYLVAAHAGQPIRAYSIADDGVTVTTSAQGEGRVAFDLHEMPEEAQADLLRRAGEALAALKQGASNPIHYVEMRESRTE